MEGFQRGLERDSTKDTLVVGPGLESRAGRLLGRGAAGADSEDGDIFHFKSRWPGSRQEGPEIYVVQIGQETWGRK